MVRSLVVWIVMAALAAILVDKQVAAQEYRTTVRDLDRRFNELVRLNQRLATELERREQAIAATTKNLAHRIEVLERARQQAEAAAVGSNASSDESSIEQTRETIKNLNAAVEQLRSQIEQVKRRLRRLESLRNVEPLAQSEASDGSDSVEASVSSQAESSGVSDADDHRFHFRARVYDNYEAFKRSPDFEVYQEENRRAGARFSASVQNGELQQQAAINVLAHRRQLMLNDVARGQRPGRL
jgi:DNA repair exonuclease SbcCD ATPase subunit